jgi:hypothetical protein
MATESNSLPDPTAALIRRLMELTGAPTFEPLLETTAEAAPQMPVLNDADAIVAHIEINDKHGVGALIRKLFGSYSNILSIRSKDFYQGQQDFGDCHLCIAHENAARDEVFWNVLASLGKTTVRRILAVPYFPDDVRTALALKEIFGVPLCTYLMDDQNLCADGIPDALMDELLAKSSLRLAISPELHAGYELKFGYKMWYMPPLVSMRLILPYLNPPRLTALRAREAVIIGNIWGERWLNLLRDVVRDSGVTLRWYCNGDFRWLPCDKATLAKDGVIPHEGPALSDDELVQVLRDAPFVVVPSGVLDDSDDRRFIAQLSLPSRIPYILASSQTPILILGDSRTAAARFIRDLGIGMVAPYERERFLSAIEDITQPETNILMRAKAFSMAARFVDIGAAEWIWQSMAQGHPIDRRYEDMLPDRRADLQHLVVPLPQQR